MFRIGKWRYVAGRMDAANVAGQDQEIYRTDDGRKSGPKPRGRVSLQGCDSSLCRISICASLKYSTRIIVFDRQASHCRGHTVSGDSPLSMQDKPSLDGSTREARMSALAQKRTLRGVRPMSALPPKADMDQSSRDVRFVPKADILRCSKERRYSMTSSAIASSDGGTFKRWAFAVFRLITKSNLVGCTTGRSSGLAPLRILPV